MKVNDTPASGTTTSLINDCEPRRDGKRPLAYRISEKEADHLAAGIWPACVGVGSVRAAAGPCVTEAMNHPLLQNLVAARVGVHSAAVASASRRLSLADRKLKIRHRIGL